jgi:hypothetical protein
LGQKQTCAAHKPMSAKCQKRTLPQLIRSPRRRRSVAQWHSEAQRFGCFQVDQELEFCRLHHRQIVGFSPASILFF